MSKNNKTPNTNRDNVLNELLNEFDEERVSENVDNGIGAEENLNDTENTVEETGNVSSETAVSTKKHTFYFVFAVLVILMAVVGIVSIAVFAVGKINSAVNSSSLRDEYTRFLLPVVANDIAPFENENELSNSAKINCSIWNIMFSFYI